MYSDHHQQDYYGGGGGYSNQGGDPYGGYGGGYGGYDQGAYSGGGYDQGAYGGYPQQPGPGQGYMGGAPNIPFNPMIADLAKQYGENLMGQGKAAVDKELQKFVSVSKLKYYFAVDTTYVMKKMGLLFFPFTHKDWSIHYGKNEDDAVQPRFEVNAPDLYIPLMAFITFILVAGISLGMQQKFSPEMLGMQSSSALGWLILELMIFTGCTYIIQTDLKVLDLLTFCSYKFVGMIFILASALVLGKSGYYSTLAYFSLSLSVFLVKTLKKQIYSVTTHEHVLSGNKRRLYFLLTLAGAQPFLMWWLTYHLTIW